MPHSFTKAMNGLYPPGQIVKSWWLFEIDFQPKVLTNLNTSEASDFNFKG